MIQRDTLVDVSFNTTKRDWTVQLRGLDFGDAGKVFAGTVFTSAVANPQDYDEDRFISFGHLGDRRVVLVWTPRDNTHRIISMRHAHADEHPG